MAARRNVRTQQYRGTVTTAGNSKGDWFDAEFFRAHPEFSGKVDVTVSINGQVLVSGKRIGQRASEDEIDSVMLSFLRFLQKQMAEHPELIEPMNRAQLARILKLVKGVEVE